MSKSKITLGLMVTATTVTFIAIALALALNPYPTSVKGTAPSSSGMKLCKHFEYEYLLEGHESGWKETDWYISGLEVLLWKADCDNLICHGYTDEMGNICWDGLTEGGYYITFSWNGVDYKESIYLCCNAENWQFKDNYLPPKGEDGAFSSFSSEVASPTRFLGF
jgi:hypothetical protein